MQLYQYMRKFVRQNNIRTGIMRIGLPVLLALALLGGLMGAGITQAHAQEHEPSAAHSAGVLSIIYQVFGPYGDQATRVAQCESGLNPDAASSFWVGGSHAAGLFQILYPSTWYTTSQADLSPYDAVANTRAAHDIFVRDGYSWREWTCQP